MPLTVAQNSDLDPRLSTNLHPCPLLFTLITVGDRLTVYVCVTPLALQLTTVFKV